MANKLSESNKPKFYEFIVQYEKVLYQEFGRFDIKNQALVSFCERNRILLGSDCISNSRKIPQFKHFILWEDRKPERFKVKGNDSAHNLLRHLRNAMAHGNVISENRQRFSLVDYNETKKQTMHGKISSVLLFDLLSCLIQTYK